MSRSKNKKKMSDKAKAANRQNAQHSTGPKTPEGKEKSKFNAIKTRIFCSEPIVPGERLEDYEAFRDLIFEDLHPTSALQYTLADDIVAELWALKRMPQNESNIEVFAVYQEDHSEQMKKMLQNKSRRVRIIKSLIAELRLAQDRAILTHSFEALVALAETVQAGQAAKQDEAQHAPHGPAAEILAVSPESVTLGEVELVDCATHSDSRLIKNPKDFASSGFRRQVDIMLSLLDVENPTVIDIIRNRLRLHPRKLAMRHVS